MFNDPQAQVDAAHEAAQETAAEAEERRRVEKKGRPTPKASQRHQEHKRPLGGVSPKRTPKGRPKPSKEQKEAERAKRSSAFEGMKRGEERYLSARDRGPVRRYIRDYVDARFNLGEWFLPIAILFVLATFLTSSQPTIAFYLLLIMYIVIIVAIVDAVLTWRQIKKRIKKKFGEDALVRGSAMYCTMRIFQMRRSRIPRPQVARGQYPS